MAKAADKPTEQNDTPKVHVTRNGDIYVNPEDVLKSEKFRRQVKEMAKIFIVRKTTD